MVKNHSDSERGNVLVNDALNTFYLRLYGVIHMVKDHSDSERGRKEGNVLVNDALNTFYLRLYGRKEIFYLTMHSTRFIYGYMEGRKYFIYRCTQHILFTIIWKEGNILFNDALNTFYLRLCGRKEIFYLTMHSTRFIYGYMEGRKYFI